MTPATEQLQTRVCGLLTFKTLRPLSPDFLSPWPLPQEVVGPRPFSGSQPPSCSSTFALPKCTPCLPWHIQTQQEAWPRESVCQDHLCGRQGLPVSSLSAFYHNGNSFQTGPLFPVHLFLSQREHQNKSRGFA